ncbi:MAG: DUF4192 domain-containing protein, partial [Micromonosporaceae bacterium]|nr:DUF4192 domain-containing protein [Micromonosporaceae bacterium]
SSPARTRLTVRSTVDLLALVPCLLGFHPADSLVVVAMRRGQVIFAARGDLPAARAPRAASGALAGQLAAVVRRQGCEAAVVIGYGPADRVAAAAPVGCDALSRQGVQVLDALRVTAGRYFSLLCADPRCCPPDGTAFDASASPLAAEAVFAGQVVLPDRDALVRQLAPVGGPARESMHLAAGRAEDRLARLLAGAAGATSGKPDAGRPAPGGPETPAGRGAAAVLRAGRAAVRQALARGEAGQRLTDDEVAWLALLLCHPVVRDFAWQRTGPDDWQIALWTDVLRRVEPDLAAAPGSLLAFAAWRSGFGSLAGIALERALDADPAYPMALVLDDMLRRGLPPSTLDGWPAVGRGGRRPRRRRASDSGGRASQRKRHRGEQC